MNIPNKKGNDDLKIEVANTFDGLAKHAEKWDNLALIAPQHLPMLSYSWVAPYLKHLIGLQDKWYFYFAYDRNQLVGVLPVIVSSKKYPGIS